MYTTLPDTTPIFIDIVIFSIIIGLLIGKQDTKKYCIKELPHLLLY
jgi:hypothetical protein